MTIYSHALAAGISRGFLVASGIALMALIITVVTIRVRRADLAGASSGRRAAEDSVLRTPC